ncbi:MAG: creatininase family protein [Euryarchaeota archaeon]|nr:creatininase family protein [Euryarchaeota archaeon]MDE1837620.1 creatininase family protein [Euryarchaeota archaeon]MDE1880812.1 creatininase family protein [Euryarchaeota archaeon]MDE2045949.1 creatininase family protein [Thermoplasmata archaeon]
MSKVRRRIDQMDSRTLEREAKKGRVLILPVGALEAHGPHLPLASDMIQAEATALALSDRIDALVAPGLPYGICPGTRRFPGTVSHSIETLAETVHELLEEFYRFGFRRVLILSGHGAGNHMAALREGATHSLDHHPNDLKVACLCDYEFVYELRGKEAPQGDGHGGLLETSRVMALAPQLVGSARPKVDYNVPPSLVGPVTEEHWSESVIGDTTEASPELGEKVQAYVLDRLEETVRKALPP